MKKVNSPQQTAHLFALQTQSESRTPNGSLYFNGNSIYSYGSHFCIAKFIDDKTLLFTERSYSNTTGKHISVVSYATSHIEKIYCSNPNGSHDTNFDFWLRQAEQSAEKLKTARKPQIYIWELENVKSKANIYANYFCIDIPETLRTVLKVTTKAEILAYMLNKSELIAKEKAAKEKLALKNHKIELKKWRNFGTTKLYTRAEGIDYIRKNTDYFETSQGVKIPLAIGQRFYNNLAAAKVGDKFLDYTINEITKTYIGIGCHKITLKEINNVTR